MSFLQFVFRLFKLRDNSNELSRDQLLSYIRFHEDPINNRDKRLHPFISESLDVIFKSKPELKNIIVQGKLPVNENAQILASIFNKNGSDKSSRHSYEGIYSDILNQFDNPKILEIGLGSINAFPYAGLNPGGSMKSWREYKPSSTLIGADIDNDAILAISEIGIQVDQTSDESLIRLREESKKHCLSFDLVIDDGFHDPHANIRTLFNLFEVVAEDGFYVIEDVHASLIVFWLICSPHLPGFMKIYDLRNQRPGIEDNIIIVFRKQRDKQEDIGGSRDYL